MSQPTHVFYTPATAQQPRVRIHDFAIQREDGSYVGECGGQSAQAMAERYGCTVLVGEYLAVKELEQQSLITAPKLIEEDRYDEMLNILPPMRWGSWQGVESFRMSEFYRGKITTIFARTSDGRFWEFMDNGYMSGDDIAAKVIAAAKLLDTESSTV